MHFKPFSPNLATALSYYMIKHRPCVSSIFFELLPIKCLFCINKLIEAHEWLINRRERIFFLLTETAELNYAFFGLFVTLDDRINASQLHHLGVLMTALFNEMVSILLAMFTEN